MHFVRDRARRHRAAAAVVMSAAAAAIASDFAVAKTWDNTSGDALWNTAINWDDNFIPNTGTPVILPLGTPGGVPVITAVGAGAGAQSLTFNDSYTLNGTSVLTLGNGDVTVANGLTGTIELPVAGGSGLHKLSPGTLVLSGTNTYTGGTRLDVGVLSVAADANLGAAAGAINFNGVGTLLRTTASFETSRGVAFSVGGSAGSGGFDVAAGTTLTASGVIGGIGKLTKIGAGTLVLDAANTYGGDTQISQGVLAINADDRLGGATSDNVILSGSGTLRATAAMTTGRTITVDPGSSTLDLPIGAGTFTANGIFTGTGNLTKTGSGTLVISGSGGNSNSGLTTIAAGTVRLNRSGGAAIAGSLTINTGAIVVLDTAEQIGTVSDVTVQTNGILDLNGFSETIRSVTMTSGEIDGFGTLVLGAGAAGGVTSFGAAAPAVIRANVNLGGFPRPFTVTNGAAPTDLMIVGSLTNGALVKENDGLLVLTGDNPNSISTMTVNGGTVVLQKPADINAAGGTITVGDGLGNDKLRIAASEQIVDTGSLVIAGSGEVEIPAGVTEALTNVTMTGLGRMTGTGTLLLLGNVTTNSSPQPAQISNRMELLGSRTFNVADGAADDDLLVTGEIASGNLVKAGAGQLRLASASFRSGATTIADGRLSIAADSYLGVAGGQLDFGNGGSGTPTLAATDSFLLDRVITINAPAVAGFDVAATRTLTVVSAVSGNGGVLKTGGGTLATAANFMLTGTVGTLTVNGGSFAHTAGNKQFGGRLLVGNGAGTFGNYTLGGGTLGVSNNVLGVGSAAVGVDGDGTFVQTGGTFNVNGFNQSLVIGQNATGVGTYAITAGTLNARRLHVGRDNGSAGTVNVLGGTTNVGFDVEIALGAGASGTVHVNGGSMTAPAIYVGGTSGGGGGAGILSVAGGTATATGELRVWDTPGGTAINLSTGKLSVGSLRTSGNPLRFTWSGGTLEFTSESPMIGAGADLGTSVTLSSGKTLRVTGASKTINVRGTGAVNFTGGRADLTDKKMIVVNGDVGTATGGVYTGLTRQIQLAHNGGAWDGPGITTSKPDAVAGLTAIGIGMAGDLGYDNQLFAGVTVSGNTALLMYTYAGDANVDGIISGDDYAAIDFNIAVPNSSGWHNGDFNYDGIISGDDYAAIDFNIVAQGAPFATSTSVGGVNAVPEPAGTVALLAGCLALRRRARLTTDKRL
jgi:autotransporter-associated beta strand protein